MIEARLLKSLVISEEVVEELFNLHFADLCRFLGYYSRDIQLVEDCLQDVFIKLWEDRAKINIFHIKTYLYRAARNRILNALRNSKTRGNHEELWFTEEMDKAYAREVVDYEQFSLLYDEAVSSLPDRCRLIFQSCKDNKKTYKQVADELNLSVKTVENQMSIAYKKITNHIIERYQGVYSKPLILLFVSFLESICLLTT